MQAEIITIGDELLIGQVINTNASFIAEELNKTGINVIQITVISDNREQIIRSLNEASDRATIIIMTGGLGPTNDDITKHTLTEYFNARLVLNEKLLEHIKLLLSQRGVELNNKNINQAMVPDNCKIMHNDFGTAPGMWFEKDNNIYISLPGVPYEMKNIFLNRVIPEIKLRYNLPVIKHLTILTHGLPESVMASRIETWEKSLPPSIKLAYLPSPGILRLRLSAYGLKTEEVTEQLKYERLRLEKLIKDYIFGYDNDSLEKVIGDALKQKKLSIAVAESCTGGRIAELITSVSGASDYFMGSVTAYSNQSKCDILGVNVLSIKKHGAVSKEVVEEMATGVRKIFKADVSIATTGIAGPSGGTPKKPVGTTWIAVNTKNLLYTKNFIFGDNRERNIQKASVEALFILLKVLMNS
jgi:nicotinamide-nucleotide amidase